MLGEVGKDTYPAGIHSPVDLGLLAHLIELRTSEFLVGIISSSVKSVNDFSSFVDTALHQKIAW